LNPDFNRLIPSCLDYFLHKGIYQFTMHQPQNRQIADLVQSAKEQYGDFSDAKKREIFEIIKEAKSRGLLRKQPHDKCLSDYVNAANHLLRSYPTEEFTAALNRNLDYVYVYVALVGINSILTTA